MKSLEELKVKSLSNSNLTSYNRTIECLIRELFETEKTYNLAIQELSIKLQQYIRDNPSLASRYEAIRDNLSALITLSSYLIETLDEVILNPDTAQQVMGLLSRAFQSVLIRTINAMRHYASDYETSKILLLSHLPLDDQEVAYIENRVSTIMQRPPRYKLFFEQLHRAIDKYHSEMRTTDVHFTTARPMISSRALTDFMAKIEKELEEYDNNSAKSSEKYYKEYLYRHRNRYGMYSPINIAKNWYYKTKWNACSFERESSIREQKSSVRHSK